MLVRRALGLLAVVLCCVSEQVSSEECAEETCAVLGGPVDDDDTTAELRVELLQLGMAQQRAAVGANWWSQWIMAAVVIAPQLVGFLLSYVLLRFSASGKPLEDDGDVTRQQTLGSDDDVPKGFWYIVERAGPMWFMHILTVFVASVATPSHDYVYLNYFARQHTDLPPAMIHCETDMTSSYCSAAVPEVMRVQVAKGLISPIVQFVLGPALGVLSDAYGRKPAVIFIRVCYLISMAATGMCAWFGVSVWLDVLLSPFGMVPCISVPFAWYIDRVGHAATVIVTSSLVDGSSIVFGLFGMVIGSVISMQAAYVVGTVGRLLALLYVVFLLPESLPPERRTALRWQQLVPGVSLNVLFRSQLVKKIAAIAAINAFHWGGFFLVFSRYLQGSLYWTREDNYMSGILNNLSGFLWLCFGMQLLVRMFGSLHVLVLSTVLAVVANVFEMLSTERWQVLLTITVLSGPSQLGAPVLTGTLSRAAPQEEQGVLQSVLLLIMHVAEALGPVAFATVYEALDPAAPGAASWKMSAYIIYGALFTVPALLLTWSLWDHQYGSSARDVPLAKDTMSQT